MRRSSGGAVNLAGMWVWAARFAPFVLFAVVLLGAMGLRVSSIAESLPYCRHVDERTWVEISWRMLREGDPNPKRFTKPSLPVYTMVAGAWLGLASTQVRGEASGTKELGSRAFPFYRIPSAVAVPKWLFAGASVLALGLIGRIAQRVTGQVHLLWLTPLIGMVSQAYFTLSWWYLNVDILGAFFVAATIAYVVSWHLRGSLPGERGAPSWRPAVIAGVLCGATTGCKYNLGLIVLPCLLQVLFGGRVGAVRRALLLAGAMVVTFLVTTPFAVGDSGRFIADVQREIRHYATGHAERTAEPGFDAFARYAREFVRDWGLLLVPALAGVVTAVRANWRLAALMFSFPAAFVAYMSTQRTIFERNLVAVHLFVALAVSLGLWELDKLVGRWLARRWDGARWLCVASAGLTALLAVTATPWRSVADAYDGEIESRRTAVRWIERNLKSGTEIVVDQCLELDPRPIEGRYSISYFERSTPERKRGGAMSRPGAKRHDPRNCAPPKTAGQPAGRIGLVALDAVEPSERDGFEVLAQFGSASLHPDGLYPWQGDPRLGIVRF